MIIKNRGHNSSVFTLHLPLPMMFSKSKLLKAALQNIAVFLLTGIVIFTVAAIFIPRAFTENVKIANWYPEVCEGDWELAQNAQGALKLSADSPPDIFSNANSAVYQGGTHSLVCRNFQELELIAHSRTNPFVGTVKKIAGRFFPVVAVSAQEATGSAVPQGEMTQEEQSETTGGTAAEKKSVNAPEMVKQSEPQSVELPGLSLDFSDTEIVSARIYLSFALVPAVQVQGKQSGADVASQETSGHEQPQEQPQEQPPQEPLLTPPQQQGGENALPSSAPDTQSAPQEGAPENSGETPLQNTPQTPEEPPGVTVELQEPLVKVEPVLQTKPHISLWYSFDSEQWWKLQDIPSLATSNLENGGYFAVDGSFIKTWEDLKNLQVKFEGVVQEEETGFLAYLDAVWVEIKYQKKKSEAIPMPTSPAFVWQEFDGWDNEIFAQIGDNCSPSASDCRTAAKITDNDFEDRNPFTNGKIIVWEGERNNRWQIFAALPEFFLERMTDFLQQYLFGRTSTGMEIVQITDSYYTNTNPVADGRRIVWQAWLDGSWNILAYDLEEKVIMRLTAPGARNQMNPAIEGDFVAWQGQDARGNWQIYLARFDDPNDPFAARIEQITYDDLDNEAPSLRGGRLRWQKGKEGTSVEIDIPYFGLE